MKVMLLKTLSGLAPADEEAREALKRFRVGETLSAEIRKPRNVQFHRKFFALVGLVFENLPEDLEQKYRSTEELLTEIKFQVGHFDEHRTIGGKTMCIPRSINFASMDELEFSKFYKSVVDVVCSRILKGVTSQQLEEELVQFM